MIWKGVSKDAPNLYKEKNMATMMAFIFGLVLGAINGGLIAAVIIGEKEWRRNY